MKIHGSVMSKISKRFFIGMLSLVFVFFTFGNAESVVASVDTQEVVEGNSVQLRIEAEGGAAAFPNIKQISGIRVSSTSTSRSNSMSIINGEVKNVSKTTRMYGFTPKHDMIIPSYSVNVSGKKYKTKPIQIRVVKSHAPTATNNGRYVMQLQADKNSVLVGESFMLTMFLSISDKLGRVQVGNFVPPSSADFFLKQIGEQKEYRKDKNTVLEMRYIVTPKKEGVFAIDSARARLGLEDRSRQDIFGRYGVQWKPVVSNQLSITVLGQPKDTDLVGDFTLTEKIDATKVKANKPVNLTVEIEGKGNLEDYEFPAYEIDGVTVYSDEAKVESHIVDNELVSSYVKNFAFISAEDFVIPKVDISTYNPQSKQNTILTIKSYDVAIEKAKKTSSVKVPKETRNMVQTNLSKNVKQDVALEKSGYSSQNVNFWWLGLAFVSGMFSMYVLRFFPILKKNKNPYKESEALKILYAHITEGSDVEEMVRKLYAKKNGDTSVDIDKKELREMVERFR